MFALRSCILPPDWRCFVVFKKDIIQYRMILYNNFWMITKQIFHDKWAKACQNQQNDLCN